ncbi:MAG: CdaR family protein [Lachnospiraceae bacterium]|nr:CdaR family protein [Lachnospiraceae bacterium]
MIDRGNEPKERMDERNLTGDISVRRSPLADWTARIVVVLLAFMIWFFVMSVNSTDIRWSIGDVPVEIVNESGLSVLSGDEVTVDVTITGRRNMKNSLSASDLRTYVTVEEGTEAGKYTFDISVDLPSGVQLDSLSQSRLSLYLDNTATTTVPVSVRLTDYMLESGYELDTGGIVCSPASIRVTGPEAVLNTIGSAAVVLELGKVTRTVNYNGSVVLIDQSGSEISNSYVKMQTSSVTVTVPVTKTRQMPLEVGFLYGYFNDKNVKITAEPAVVTIRGSAEAVDAAEWRYTVNEKEILSADKYTVPFRLPAGVTAEDAPESVVITIEPVGTVTRTLTVSDFVLNNPNGLSASILTESLSVTVRGPEQTVRYLTPAAITASVDLSAAKQSEGKVTLPVSFSFASGYAGVYELGNYTLTVAFGEPEESETEAPLLQHYMRKST